MLINLELKFYDPDSDWFEQSVVKTIKPYAVDHRIVITARYPENISRLNTLDPSLDCTILQKERDKDIYFKMLRDFCRERSNFDFTHYLPEDST